MIFIVPLDDPNEESTEQWQDGRDDQCSVKPTRISRDVSQRRATASVRVSNAGPAPSAQTVRYRRHVNVTHTVPQETMVSCFHRSHQLLPGSNAVSVYLSCLDCRHHAKWTQRTGPKFQEFPELQRIVQAWWAKLRRVWIALCTRFLWLMHFRQVACAWTPFTWIFETAWSNVFDENV